MVFRFTPSQDLEMMRELIRQKPFAAKRGATLEVWDNVAAALSTALQQKVKVKQIRDRLNLLKARLKANEQASFLTSGVEESLDAINIQSHYSDVDGKEREYVELVRLHIETKAAEKLSKEKKEEFHIFPSNWYGQLVYHHAKCLNGCSSSSLASNNLRYTHKLHKYAQL
ncbi:hypothetical protein PC121_g23157 [Phytophthora cactorum]|nr:hypothetical protein PC120_g25351 [Phytophthora cactorum]KAG3042267.1 hypothetical protein PC121_g23157 [Phytophthora cactorum]KAG4038615.1 hypothetical protein PC123_g25823 [Phytophthora cactorum]